MREQLDSYGRIGVGALVGAAVAALLYGGLAYSDQTPVDLARHPEVEPVQPASPTRSTTALDAASLTTTAKPTTTGSSTTTTTTTTTTTKQTTTTTHHTTTTIAQPTTTTHEDPPPVTTTTTRQHCGLLWC
ncbi:hypothetical protein [Labedaea rhizosphaerae]|uniref:hypothetical protein n=1 Tax=Labedaea rhizosphaerae TaxID=598644 RepID=UPI00105CE751|nr:hypothetical protein [Labedaea rhizosphaerae]